MQREFFARCASGFESVLAAELKELACERVRPLQGGVAFFGEAKTAQRVCLYSRVATRIQWVLARIPAEDAQTLYQSAAEFPWEEYMRSASTIAVQAHGANKNLRNTQFSALKVKDAVCDRLRSINGIRPNVDTKAPDCAIDVVIHETKASLYANLSGASLHRRGYREEGVQVEAPLKETLAAGILLAAGWDDLAKTEALCADPLCGSGTLAIEAALVAADVAPGLLRTHWGFMGWQAFDTHTWETLLQEAIQRKQEGIARIQARGSVVAVAGDSNARAVSLARACAKRAGVENIIAWYEDDASCLAKYLKQFSPGTSMGLLVTNPPYGVRLQPGQLEETYAALAHAKDALPSSWRMAIITPDTGIDSALGQSPDHTIACYNGPLEATVRIYTHIAARTILHIVSLEGREHTLAVAEPNSEQFAMRLRKVAKQAAKWARKEGLGAYRIYDADLPDYAFAIDYFETVGTTEGQQTVGTTEGQHFVRMAEYQAPASVDAARADRRFADARALVPAVLDLPQDHVFTKVRKKAKGGGQYREAHGIPYVVHVREANYVFEVDLGSYVDTGLFLDHRLTRALLGGMAAGTRFLNLFAYTGTASVYAAGGGARQTTTVDLSQTYLNWAQRNMQTNGFTDASHHFVRADVWDWIKDQHEQKNVYDLVFCDPPTFSNSKAMGTRTFDVQRDHVELLSRIFHILAPGGSIVFSCNKRSFKLKGEALAQLGLEVENITTQTIPSDFARNPKIHSCFVLQKR